jgi:methylmalonyl-CoA mutase C-terminal domain/subunit
LSCLSGAHMALFPKTIALLREKGGKDVVVVGGGIIPDKDLPKLMEAGMARIFGPGTPLGEIVAFIEDTLEGSSSDSEG